MERGEGGGEVVRDMRKERVVGGDDRVEGGEDVVKSGRGGKELVWGGFELGVVG